MAGVILENVSRVYPGNVAAVRGIDLEVHDREFLVFVGPSGCGKTTTLRLIAGLEELSSGSIKIGSRVVNDVPPKNRDIAMVFQNYALYPHMTVYRNLAFGLELRERIGGIGWLWRWALPAGRKAELAAKRFSIAQRVHQTAKTLGIEPLLDRHPRQLSGGERQRVALGRAIVRNPAVFLFDEPLSNLDAKLRVEMRRELKQLHGRLQTTMIYVTHDQVEALTLGQRIVVMNGGTIQQVGDPMEIYDRPANRFVAGFVGTPAMNFVEGEVSKSGPRWQFKRGNWIVDIDDSTLDFAAAREGAAVLGIRPEHVRLVKQDGAFTPPGGVVSVVELLGDAAVVTVAVKENRAADAAKTDHKDTTKDNRTPEDQHHYAEHKDKVLNVLSKTEPRTHFRSGDRVGIELERGQIHLFDPRSGESWMRKPAVV